MSRKNEDMDEELDEFEDEDMDEEYDDDMDDDEFDDEFDDEDEEEAEEESSSDSKGKANKPSKSKFSGTRYKRVKVEELPDWEIDEIILRKYKRDADIVIKARYCWEDLEDYIAVLPDLEYEYDEDGYGKDAKKEVVIIPAARLKDVLMRYAEEIVQMDSEEFADIRWSSLYNRPDLLLYLPDEEITEQRIKRSIGCYADCAKAGALYMLLSSEQKEAYGTAIVKSLTGCHNPYDYKPLRYEGIPSDVIDRALEDDFTIFTGLSELYVTRERLYNFIRCALADEKALERAKKDSYDFENVPKDVWDRISWIGAVQVSPGMLNRIPEEYLSYRLIMYAYNKAERLNLSGVFRDDAIEKVSHFLDEDEMVKCVILNPWRLDKLPEKYCNDDFYYKCALAGGSTFSEWVPGKDKIKARTWELILKQWPSDRQLIFFGKFPKAILNSEECMKAYMAVTDNLRDKDVQKKLTTELVKIYVASGRRYRSDADIPEKLFDDELVDMIVRKNGYIRNIPKKFLTDEFYNKYKDIISLGEMPMKMRTRETVLAALVSEKHHVDFKDIPEQFRGDSEIVNAFIDRKHCGPDTFIPHVDQGLQTNETTRILVERLIKDGKLKPNSYMVGNPDAETLELILDNISAKDFTSGWGYQLKYSDRFDWIADRLVQEDPGVIVMFPARLRAKYRAEAKAAEKPVSVQQPEPSRQFVPEPKLISGTPDLAEAARYSNDVLAAAMAGECEQLSFTDFFKFA